jgi:hypothetical protein
VVNDLTVLAPPFLVAAVFLIAVGAFLRREMRRGKNAADDEGRDQSAPDSTDRHLSAKPQNPSSRSGDAERGRTAGADDKDDVGTKPGN